MHGGHRSGANPTPGRWALSSARNRAVRTRSVRNLLSNCRLGQVAALLWRVPAGLSLFPARLRISR